MSWASYDGRPPSGALLPVGQSPLHPDRDDRHYQRAVRDLGTLFAGDEVIAAAILDRLLHYSHVFLVTGPSCRMKGKLAQRVGNPADVPDDSEDQMESGWVSFNAESTSSPGDYVLLVISRDTADGG